MLNYSQKTMGKRYYSNCKDMFYFLFAKLLIFIEWKTFISKLNLNEYNVINCRPVMCFIQYLHQINFELQGFYWYQTRHTSCGNQSRTKPVFREMKSFYIRTDVRYLTFFEQDFDYDLAYFRPQKIYWSRKIMKPNMDFRNQHILKYQKMYISPLLQDGLNTPHSPPGLI